MLKTNSCCIQLFEHFQVSIPHRYAENLEVVTVYTAAQSVSIPHRYAENVSPL